MKTIIFCADGTWNGVNDADHNGDPELTNVRRFFDALKRDSLQEELPLQNEQEVKLSEEGQTIQIAKYLHGVGDTRNHIRKMFEGAVGAGVVQRIVRGYTFISRNYEPGDRIVLTGFSRGAYTARALGGLIASEGVLRAEQYDWDEDDERSDAYAAGSLVWWRCREKSAHPLNSQIKLEETFRNFLSRLRYGYHHQVETVEVDELAAIGVWDTVGALGLPRFDSDGHPIDAYKFANTALNDKVKLGFHAIAADEKRQLFSPCLWEPRDGVTQVLFAGSHADVGGGYPKKESGLSNAPLAWMMQALQSTVGLHFCEPFPEADQTAKLHDESINPLFTIGANWRSFDASYRLHIHQSLVDRSNAVSDYAPVHLGPDYWNQSTGFAPIYR